MLVDSLRGYPIMSFGFIFVAFLALDPSPNVFLTRPINQSDFLNSKIIHLTSLICSRSFFNWMVWLLKPFSLFDKIDESSFLDKFWIEEFGRELFRISSSKLKKQVMIILQRMADKGFLGINFFCFFSRWLMILFEMAFMPFPCNGHLLCFRKFT